MKKKQTGNRAELGNGEWRIGNRYCCTKNYSTSEVNSSNKKKLRSTPFVSNLVPLFPITYSLFPILISLFFVSCISLVDKTGRALDGSAFKEKKIAVYKTAKDNPAGMEILELINKQNERSFQISLSLYPAMKIRGTRPDKNGNFNLVSLEYLGGNTHGWNEYSLEIVGEGKLFLTGKAAALSIQHGIEPVQISSGKIRRYDTRLTGEEALTGLRNRRERITALAEWMKEQENVPAAVTIKEFEKNWKPVLFPEIVSKKKRPQGWQAENDRLEKAEDVKWNTGYTERVFSEALRNIRDSGTMLRDWEEALEWIYIEYNWENIIKQFSKETILDRIK